MKSQLIFVSCLLSAIIIAAGASAQEKPYSIGVMVGSFMPQDRTIQGTQTITYNQSGEITGAYVSGFGNGVDLAIYGTYYFTDWGIRLEAGPRLLHKHKLDIEINGIRHYFENRMDVIPITLTMFHKIQLPNIKTIPYIGIGPGVYFANLEQKRFYYWPTTFRRDWNRIFKVLMGVHFLTGFNFPAYHNLYFCGELKYSYISGDWEIKDVDSDAKTKYENLNIGGTSLRFGLNYKF